MDYEQDQVDEDACDSLKFSMVNEAELKLGFEKKQSLCAVHGCRKRLNVLFVCFRMQNKHKVANVLALVFHEKHRLQKNGLVV